MKDLDALFELHWADSPVFPVPEEHARHKIVSKTAYVAGYRDGLKEAMARFGVDAGTDV